MASRVEVGGLRIDEQLYRLVRDEIVPGTGVKVDGFWKSLSAIVRDLGPKNRALLAKRDRLQKQIDEWHLARSGQPFNLPVTLPFCKRSVTSSPRGKILKSPRPTSTPRSLRSPGRSWWCRSTTPAMP